LEAAVVVLVGKPYRLDWYSVTAAVDELSTKFAVALAS